MKRYTANIAIRLTSWQSSIKFCWHLRLCNSSSREFPSLHSLVCEDHKLHVIAPSFFPAGPIYKNVYNSCVWTFQSRNCDYWRWCSVHGSGLQQSSPVRHIPFFPIYSNSRQYSQLGIYRQYSQLWIFYIHTVANTSCLWQYFSLLKLFYLSNGNSVTQ